MREAAGDGASTPKARPAAFGGESAVKASVEASEARAATGGAKASVEAVGAPSLKKGLKRARLA